MARALIDKSVREFTFTHTSPYAIELNHSHDQIEAV
jgi:hypothetical protein